MATWEEPDVHPARQRVLWAVVIVVCLVYFALAVWGAVEATEALF